MRRRSTRVVVVWTSEHGYRHDWLGARHIVLHTDGLGISTIVDGLLILRLCVLACSDKPLGRKVAWAGRTLFAKLTSEHFLTSVTHP